MERGAALPGDGIRREMPNPPEDILRIEEEFLNSVMDSVFRLQNLLRLAWNRSIREEPPRIRVRLNT